MLRPIFPSNGIILFLTGIILHVFLTFPAAGTPNLRSDPAKLLLTEISTLGTEQEYIEICNPGTAAVDLSECYLTDGVYSTADIFYWRIAEGNPTYETVGGGSFYDFHAKFPDGYSIAAGDTIVISVPGSTAFYGEFGVDPDLEMFEDGPEADDVPDMSWIFGDEINNSIINRTGTGAGQPSTPTLNNGAETVVLYHWVTGEDEVTDIDVFAWKDPSYATINMFFNKTGITVGSHTYLPEIGTNTTFAFGEQNSFGNSYQRTDPAEGNQISSGSNGVDGRDETSEDFNTTFTMLPYQPSIPPPPLPDPDKLLITEVSTVGSDQEYIEVFNPGAGAVDLSDYYLTDAVNSPGNIAYWRIAEGNPVHETVGGGSFTDFHARFPDGFFISTGDTIVITVAGSDAFFDEFGFDPDLEFFEDGGMPDSVPDMRWIFGDEINNSIINRTGSGSGQPSSPTLSNVGETVVLYHWVTGQDKVTDVDVFAWKDPVLPTTDFFFNKTGVTVGGHTYLPETGTNEFDAFGAQNTFGDSYHRIDATEGDQVSSGSNGIAGQDETSEDFNTTFAMMPYDPSPPPIPAPDPEKLLLTEISTIWTAREYIEICNPGPETVDLSDYYLTDAIFSTANQVYWLIAAGNPSQATVGGGAFFDFHARFPDGFTIAAGDTIVISVAGSDPFYWEFGFDPHLELFEDGAEPDTVPDMRWIFGDEINNSIINRTGSGSGQPSTPGLTNAAETVVLYHWITGQDKITDIDVFAWKDPSSTNTSIFFNKTFVIVGGHSYLPEWGTHESRAFGSQNNVGDSYHRIDPTEGDQISSGSNGVDGRDETSENFPTTFEMLPYDPARPPTPVVPTVGDWQFAGGGPIIHYPSVAHTWGDFNNNGGIDLLLILPGEWEEPVLINQAGMFSGSVEIVWHNDPFAGSDCVRGDFDQDGDLDMYLVKPEGPDWFFINGGELYNFELWGWAVGSYGGTPSVILTSDVSVVDTNLDGYLELFVNNRAGINQLLDGRFGFTDLMPYSLFHEPGTTGSAWCDLDGDRDPDLAFMAPNEGLAISIQDEPRRFDTTWLPAPFLGEDGAWVDFDNDGDFDFSLVCDGSNNIIYKNLGDGTFAQIPLVHAGPDSTTGLTWGDYDNDGYQDLHVTNTGEPNVLWHNDAGAGFTAVEDTVIGHSGDDFGSSWHDIDLDGDLDIFISNTESANRLVRNNLDSENNWLQIVVKGHPSGNQSNFAAIGAVIELEAGGMVQRRYVGGQEAGPGHSPLIHHFGLGEATSVDRVTVHWPFRLPNGSFHSTVTQIFSVNNREVIEETVYGISAAEPVPTFTNSLRDAQPNPFNPVTVIGFSVKRETAVFLDIFDVRGRLVRRLVDGKTREAGVHQVEWNGKTEAGADAPSGVYFYRISAGDFSASRRMALIR